METDINAANDKIAELQAFVDELEAELIQITYLIETKVNLSSAQLAGRSEALANRFKERKELGYADRASELKGNALALAAEIKAYIDADLEM